MTREKLGRNLMIMNGVVKCRIKRKSKFHEWTSPYQGEHAYSVGKDGTKKARPVLLKWLGECETAIAEERWEQIRATHIRGGTPTVAEILTVYKRECEARQATSGTPVTTSITAGKNCLKRVCKGCGVALTDRLDKLTPETVDKWVRESTGNLPKGETRDRAVYVMNSVLTQARCVFAHWLIERYRKAGIELPECVTRWPRYGDVWTPKYRDPPAALKRKTMEAAETLRREQPKVWTLFWLIVNFGCRPGDALRLKWSNFKTLPGESGERRYLVYEPNKTRRKNGAVVTIPVTDKVWTALTEGHEEQISCFGPDQQIVETYDGKSGREGTLRALNQWMRETGWDRGTYSKAAYELRKLFTSAVRNTYGVQLASDWCGSSAAMVQQYYAATYVDKMPEIDATAIIRGV
jgi:integrase